MNFSRDVGLWVLLYLLVVCVFALGFYDASLRSQVLDFAKVALGGVLGLITASAGRTSSV